jgi:hypothetical protein
VVFADVPGPMASARMLKTFDSLLVALSEKIQPLFHDSPDARDLVQCLKVVYLNAGELNLILDTYRDPAAAAIQLRNRLPLTESQARRVASHPFVSAVYVEPLLLTLADELRSFSAARTYDEDLLASANVCLTEDPRGVYDIVKAGGPDVRRQLASAYGLTDSATAIIIELGLDELASFALGTIRERVLSRVSGRLTDIIASLQAATDGEGMVILTPYCLVRDDGVRGKWALDFSEFQPLIGPAHLVHYESVRPAVANLLALGTGNRIHAHLDERSQRAAPDDIRRAGSTDYVYLTTEPDRRLELEALACVLVDQWQEGIPNPDRTETTGVVLRYQSPQAEAPNALIVAVPPFRSSTERWTEDLLARTVLEVIELMQIRMVGSDDVMGNQLLGPYLPALLFPPGPDGQPLFPSRERLLHGFDVGALPGYVLASQLSATERSRPGATATRGDAPPTGGRHER